MGPRQRRTIGAVALLAAAAGSVAAEPDPGDDWIEVRVGTVVAFSRLSPRDTQRIAERVDDFDHDVFGPGRPFRAADRDTLRLFLFAQRNRFGTYGPPGYESYYQPGDGTDYLLMTEDGWERALPSAFAMEAMHRLDDASPGMPAWLRRGLARFYSTYRPDGDRAKVGRRLEAELDVLRRGTPLPWARVLEIGPASPEIRDPERLRRFDAQAWVLAHDLVTETPPGEAGVAAWTARLDAGDDPDASFAAVYGFPRAELAERAPAYARGRGFDEISFPRSDPAPSRANVTRAPVSRERILAELGEMVASLDAGADSTLARERFRLAEAHFTAALALDPSSAGAERGLGYVALRRGDAAGAVTHLRTATERAPSDLRAHALLAEALLTPFEGRSVRFSVRDRPPPPEIFEAREQLKACLALDPDRADVLIRLARTYLHDPGDPAPGIRTLRGVLPLYPGRRDVIGTLVLLLLRAGEPGSAFSFLDPGAPDDPWLRSLRGTVVDETLRLADEAWQARDFARARDLVQRVRDRRDRWGLTDAQQKTLAAFEGRKEGEAGSAPPPGEAERQYREYVRAVELCSQKKYKAAIEVLDDLLTRPNDDALHESIVTLREQARYNRALNLFERGEYAEALEIARSVKRETTHADVASLAQQLARNCRQALGK